MNGSRVALATIVIVGLIGFTVLALNGHTEAGLAMLAAVPTLASLIIGNQLAATHEQGKVAHVETRDDMNTVKAQLATVTEKVDALHNGALIPMIEEGTRRGLGAYLQTSSIVEEPFRAPLTPATGTPEVIAAEARRRLAEAAGDA